MKRFFFRQETVPVQPRRVVVRRSLARQLLAHRISLVAVLVMVFFAAYSNHHVRKQVPVRGEMQKLVMEVCQDLSSHKASQIADSVGRVSETYQLDATLVLAVMAMESRCKGDSRSRRGALGVMQVMPATAAQMGIRNPHDLDGNIDAGARYLSYLISEFGGDVSLALAAYNAGPAIVKKLKKVPPYQETQHYVMNVLSTYYRLSQVLPA